ncbi:MAG: hypothetical protein FWE27_09060 [Defluviitaleaceae bacterium]|nr:hypothetical protein [Defluviitaleaceae bacterium]
MTTAAPWQIAYVELLNGYVTQSDNVWFRLHDIDKDGIPELILSALLPDDYAGEHIIHEVYTFKDGNVISLEDGYENFIAYLNRSRHGMEAAADNFPGLIAWYNGPTAGNFGIDMVLYWRIVIDGDYFHIEELETEIFDWMR